MPMTILLYSPLIPMNCLHLWALRLHESLTGKSLPSKARTVRTSLKKRSDRTLSADDWCRYRSSGSAGGRSHWAGDRSVEDTSYRGSPDAFPVVVQAAFPAASAIIATTSIPS